MRGCKFLFVMTIILIIVSGCSRQQSPIDDSAIEEGEIEQLLLGHAQLTDAKISKVSLKYSEIEDFGDYYSFWCEADEKQYEGMAIVSDGEVAKIDLAEIDGEAGFTVHTFSGAIKNKDESKSLFFACSGKINDDNIVKVHVFLTGGVIYEVQINERKTYDIVITDNQPTILTIDAIDINGTVIYSYPPYPPEIVLLAPGGISHSGPGENRQFWPDENSQS